MTIEELLESARGYCHLADREMERDRGSLDKAAQYAAIAQACAYTAQAMMGAEARQEWLEQRAADYATDRDDYAVSSH